MAATTVTARPMLRVVDDEHAPYVARRSIRVAVISSQPMLARGIESLVTELAGFETVEHGVDGADLVVAAGDPPTSVSVPVLLSLAAVVTGAQAVRHFEGPVRGVMVFDSSPEQWRAAMSALAAGHWFVDPRITRSLVLLAAARSRHGPRPAGLTAQQQRVLEQLTQGRTNRQIADELGISPETVKSHLAEARRRLGAYDRIDAARRARALGIDGSAAG